MPCLEIDFPLRAEEAVIIPLARQRAQPCVKETQLAVRVVEQKLRIAHRYEVRADAEAAEFAGAMIPGISRILVVQLFAIIAACWVDDIVVEPVGHAGMAALQIFLYIDVKRAGDIRARFSVLQLDEVRLVQCIGI